MLADMFFNLPAPPPNFHTEYGENVLVFVLCF